MDTSVLNLSYSLLELIKKGCSQAEAATILQESVKYKDRVLGVLGSDKEIDIETLGVLNMILTRFFLTTDNYRSEEKCDELIKYLAIEQSLYQKDDFYNPELIALTSCCRAHNKYHDFVFQMMLTESLTYETYKRILNAGYDEIRSAVSKSLSIFDKVSSRGVTVILFSSLLEDAINTTINPVLKSIATNETLRKNFIVEPTLLLQPISLNVVDKIKNSLYLSDAIIKISKK